MSRRWAWGTTAQGGDVALLVNALEAGHDHHLAGLELGADAGIVDLLDARLGVGAVGEDAHLVAGIGHRLDATLEQRHGQQADGDLLAGGDHDIQLARIGLLHDLLGEADQAIGLATHGRYHHHDLVARLMEAFHLLGDLLDTLHRTHRGTAEFLYDQCHCLLPVRRKI